MKKLLLVLFAMPMLVFAERLTISNETDQQVYVAVYYVPIFGKVNRASEVLALPAGANLKLDRPAQKIGSDRQLLILPNLNFPSTFTTATFKEAGPSINVGILQAKRFYIGMENGQLRGYNEGEWQQRGKSGLVSTIAAKSTTLLGAVQAQVSRTYYAVVPEGVTQQAKDTVLAGVKDYWVSPYESIIADVRVGNAVSPQEYAVVARRTPLVRNAMESKFGKVTRVPKIALVTSGGGYRAMIFTLGFLVGAQKTGLLDMIMWMSALSGSTWALGSWLENNAKMGPMTPEQFCAQYFNTIKGKGLQSDFTQADFDQMSNLLLTDIVYGKPLTIINIYGALLSNRVFANFGNKKQTLKLSDQEAVVNSGKFPIPIYTAVSGEEGQPEYYWYAFTPWEVSMEPWMRGGTGISIPSWAYGRKFRNGQSTGYMPEQSLGFQLATYGSAIAADIETIYARIKGNITNQTVRTFIDNVVIARIGGKRLTWAAVPNFGRGLAQSPLRANDGLQLVDAGLDFNLPYPPVSGMRAERTPDIIIFVEASGTTQALRASAAYAQRKGLKFPPIDYALAAQKAVSVHSHPTDPSVPVVIFLDRRDSNMGALLDKPALQQYKNMLSGFDVEACDSRGVCATFNFNYSYEEIMRLSTLSQFLLTAYIDDIFAAIKQRAGVVNQN